MHVKKHEFFPTIRIQISKIDVKKDIIRLVVEDNGPGIPQKSIEKVFGQLLFGSRFHAIRQSRGQQGIGITGVVMYCQLTTGRTTHVRSKIATEPTAAVVDIGLDTRKNKATKANAGREIWYQEDGSSKEHGTEITAEMKAKYQKGRQSVWQYLRMTSIVNPHAEITFIDPEELNITGIELLNAYLQRSKVSNHIHTALNLDNCNVWFQNPKTSI